MSERINYGKHWSEVLKELNAENNRLKADVVELADALKLASEVGIKVADEVTRLKAEVERLRKAGDAMATNIPRMVTCQVTAHEAVDFINAWNAAKEGRPNE